MHVNYHEPRIAYIAAFDFENSPAARNRFLSLCSVLEKEFKTTKIITTFPLSNNYDTSYDTWEVRNVKKKNVIKSLIIPQLVYYIFKNAKKFDVIIIFGGYAVYMLPFILLKPFFSYKLIFDSVEIYLPPPKIKILTSPSTWNHLLGYNFLIRFFDAAVCISSFLEQKYQKVGIKTVIVPPIFLNDGIEHSLTEGDKNKRKYRILYYGSPGKKDLLDNLIKVSNIHESIREIFEIVIIGLDKEQYEKYCIENRIHDFPSNIKFKGKGGLDLVYQELVNTDFTFLQRPYTITTKAGFPSKLVEALFFQRPPILNLTSDMAYYEIDKCSIVCADDSIESLNTALNSLKNMSDKEIELLRENCMYIYKKYFSTSANVEKVKLFIESINEDKK